MRRVGRSLFFLCLVLSLSGGVLAQKRKPDRVIVRGNIATISAAPSSPSMPPDVQRRYDAFIQVWLTIRDRYFDQTYSNLDWGAIKYEFEPRVKAARTDFELHNLLNVMLGRLNKSHLGVIPPEVYQTLNDVKKEVRAREHAGDPDKVGELSPGNDDNEVEADAVEENARFGTGIELSLVNDHFMITRMDQDSAALNAGLKLGYIIEKVNGVSLANMLDRILAYNSSIHSTNIKQFVPAYVASLMLNGPRDSFVTLGYLDEKDQPREIRIKREPLKERAIVIAPNFPPQELSYEARSIDDKTGYIRFNLFAIPVISRFCESIGEFGSKDGLIIDLRGNTGGVLASIPMLAGMLTSDGIDLGTSIYRTGNEVMKAAARARNFRGRVVVLVDDRTASAAEMFALALRENGRALIVGQHTSGEALPSVVVSLPTGAKLLYPFANYRSAGGTFIEGKGIEPDRTIPVNREALLSGKDLQFERARSLLTEENIFADLKPKRPAEEKQTTTTGETAAPPVVKKASGTGAGSTLMLPPPVAVRMFPPGHDAASTKYIENFLRAIGGADAIRSISSLRAKGHASLRMLGTLTNFSFQCFRERGEKFAQILDADSTGEIREIVNGSTHIMQTDFGTDQDLSKSPIETSSDFFSPFIDLLSAAELYPSLSFTGTFDREGRKTAVVEGKTKDGQQLAFAFDAETGMLVNITKGVSSISFDDYRKVGNITLPFTVDLNTLVKVELDEIKINEPIDQAIFQKKQHCYDKAN